MDDARISAFPDRFGGSREDDDADGRDDRGPASGPACPPRSPRRLRSVEAPEPAPGPPDLRPLAEQLMAIARKLRDAELSASQADPPASQGASIARSSGTSPPSDTDPAQEDRLDPAQRRRRHAVLARKTYAARRRRGAIFGDPDLFGEPAWDILLDLYIAHVLAKDVSVSSACIGSVAPPTTGLRWLGVLADHGLLKREHDPDDQRRVLVRLTERGLEAIDRYFALASAAL